MDPEHIQAFVSTAQSASLAMMVEFPRATLVVADANQLTHTQGTRYEHPDLGGTHDFAPAVAFWAGDPARIGYLTRFFTTP